MSTQANATTGSVSCLGVLSEASRRVGVGATVPREVSEDGEFHLVSDPESTEVRSA